MSPLKSPWILMVPTNDLPELMMELMIFMMLAIVWAEPVVALPAVVFWLTVASPLVALRVTSLFIWPLAWLLTVTFELAGWLVELKSELLGSWPGSMVISPTVVGTSNEKVASPPCRLVVDCSRLMMLAISIELPLVALPAVVLSVTLASPLRAWAVILLLMLAL